MPSEAEWEYAARAGISTKWSWGDSEEDASNYAWYASNSDVKTHPVVQKSPNADGLYDMHGNVWEWTLDCWNHNYNGDPADGKAWRTGNCKSRVLRGGSWLYSPYYMRSASRTGFTTASRVNSGGFRLVQDF